MNEMIWILALTFFGGGFTGIGLAMLANSLNTRSQYNV